MSLAGDSPISLRVSPYSQRYITDRAQQLMTSVCRIYKPVLGNMQYDPITGRVTAGTPTIKYEGPCRIWEIPAGQTIVVGDDEVTVTTTWLSLPYQVSPLPEKDDVVQVLSSDDPDLVGRTLNISSTVRGGGLRASRRFQVTISDSKGPTW